MKSDSKRVRFALLVALLIATCCVTEVFADQFAKHNNEGNKLLLNGEVEQALQEYHAARVERPDQPGVLYNLGSAYHQKGAFDTATTALQNALASLDVNLKPAANYNLGNTLYRMNEYQAAIESYKQTLLANPADHDAKHNLEMALRQMNQQDSNEQKQDQQPQDKNQQDSSDQKQDQQEPQDSSGQDKQQQQPQDEGGDQESDQPSDAQNQPGEPREPRQPQQMQGMTRADAERLLDALKNSELALQKKRAQRATGEKVAKDW